MTVYSHKLIHSLWLTALLWLCHYLVASSSMYCHLQLHTFLWNVTLSQIHYTIQWVVPDNSVVYWPSSESGTGLNNHVIFMWAIHSMLAKQIAQCLCVSVCTHSSYNICSLTSDKKLYTCPFLQYWHTFAVGWWDTTVASKLSWPPEGAQWLNFSW